jgi:hypothetical protein
MNSEIKNSFRCQSPLTGSQPSLLSTTQENATLHSCLKSIPCVCAFSPQTASRLRLANEVSRLQPQTERHVSHTATGLDFKKETPSYSAGICATFIYIYTKNYFILRPFIFVYIPESYLETSTYKIHHK